MRCCSVCGAVYRADLVRCTNDGAELVETDRDPLLGTRVGAYVVDAFIGQGGMGRVYRAHHAHLAHRICALKVLLGDYAGMPAMRMRFAKEAEHASRLSHPNVAAVFDFGRTETGLLFLAMEFVEGVAFDELITNEPMAPQRVIALARQLCAGLAHAHDLGLIHRDFKPENILVFDSPTGELPKIVDFGLAIAGDHSDSRVTSTGIVMGTPAYVAPEQCIDATLDHRADLYALGVTLYEALSGGFLPFDGEPAVIVGLKVSGAAPSLARRATGIPKGLVALVDRLLDRKPDHRPVDARAVLAALDALAVDPELVALPRPARNDDTVVEANSARLRSTGMRTQHVRAPARRGAITAVTLMISAVAVAGVAWALWPSEQVAAPRIATSRVIDPQPATPPPAEPPSAEPRPAEPPPAEPPPSTRPPPSEPARRVTKRPAARPRSTRAKQLANAPGPITPVVVPPTVSPSAGPPSQPVPPRPTPPMLVVALDGLTVDGALPSATVRRALDRVMPAIRACRADRAGVVAVRFTIGETRRASGTSASGISAGVAGCVASAINGLRTETAPDVGDVEVRVRVGFEDRG